MSENLSDDLTCLRDSDCDWLKYSDKSVSVLSDINIIAIIWILSCFQSASRCGEPWWVLQPVQFSLWIYAKKRAITLMIFSTFLSHTRVCYTLFSAKYGIWAAWGSRSHACKHHLVKEKLQIKASRLTRLMMSFEFWIGSCVKGWETSRFSQLAAPQCSTNAIRHQSFVASRSREKKTTFTHNWW